MKCALAALPVLIGLSGIAHAADVPVADPLVIDDAMDAISACRSGLTTGDNPPYADGWKVKLEMSGSPRVMEAMKAKDIQTMMASMGNNRTLFDREGKPAVLTIFYSKMVYAVCGVDLPGDPAGFPALRDALIAKLELGKTKPLGRTFQNHKFQYLLNDVNDAYSKDGYAYAFHAGKFDGKDTFSIFLAKD